MIDAQSANRLRFLIGLLLIWSVVIFGRLAYLQIAQHDTLRQAGMNQQSKVHKVKPERGAVKDREGKALAMSLPVESVCLNPQRVPDFDVAAGILSGVLGIQRSVLLKNLQQEGEEGSGFLWVKRRVTREEAERLRSMKLDWIEFRTESQRFYPHGEMAAHLLGGMGMTHDQKDKDERGVAGIEEAFEADLRGKDGKMRVFSDVKQHVYETEVIQKPTAGANIVLTIDSRIQHVADRAIAKAVIDTKSTSGSVIVARPDGQILAISNYPTYDPGKNPITEADFNARKNLAVGSPFEPGSIFKVFTIASVLETTNVTPDTVFNCGNGQMTLFGRVIHDHHRYAALTLADTLAKSSNICTIQAVLRAGETNLREYLDRFGFGHKTGVGLKGESAGKVRKTWIKSSIGSVAIGHEVSATSMQLVTACNVVASGGNMVKPQLVLGRQSPGGEFERFPTEAPRRILRPETAFKLRQMMEGVVLHGTGKHAVLRGYSCAGKTGSAQIYDFKARAYTHHYNGSFMGFAPVTNPAIVVVVTLHHTPTGDAGFGGTVAAPVFREVAQEALRILDVPKDLPETNTTDKLAKAAVPDEENDLSSAELSQGPELDAVDAGERAVSSVTLPPVLAAPGSPGAGQDRRVFSGTMVPNFRGKTLRAVLEESIAAGTPVDVVGSGLAREQMPPPGSALAPGERVRVQFSR